MAVLVFTFRDGDASPSGCFLNLGKVSGANLFGEESSKGIEHERKFMMVMMSIALW